MSCIAVTKIGNVCKNNPNADLYRMTDGTLRLCAVHLNQFLAGAQVSVQLSDRTGDIRDVWNSLHCLKSPDEIINNLTNLQEVDSDVKMKNNLSASSESKTYSQKDVVIASLLSRNENESRRTQLIESENQQLHQDRDRLLQSQDSRISEQEAAKISENILNSETDQVIKICSGVGEVSEILARLKFHTT